MRPSFGYFTESVLMLLHESGGNLQLALESGIVRGDLEPILRLGEPEVDAAPIRSWKNSMGGSSL